VNPSKQISSKASRWRGGRLSIPHIRFFQVDLFAGLGDRHDEPKSEVPGLELTVKCSKVLK